LAFLDSECSLGTVHLSQALIEGSSSAALDDIDLDALDAAMADNDDIDMDDMKDALSEGDAKPEDPTTPLE